MNKYSITKRDYNYTLYPIFQKKIINCNNHAKIKHKKIHILEKSFKKFL